MYYMMKNSKMKAIVIVAIVIALLSIVLAYFLLIQPILSPYIFRSTVYKSSESFSQDICLQHPEITALRGYIASLEFADQGKQVYCYYIDNSIHDNPFYGKMPCVGAVDMQYNQEIYNSIKARVLETGEPNSSLGEFSLYIMLCDLDNKQLIVIALNDQNQMIRYSVVSNIQRTEPVVDTRSYFTMVASDLEWE